MGLNAHDAAFASAFATIASDFLKEGRSLPASLFNLFASPGLDFYCNEAECRSGVPTHGTRFLDPVHVPSTDNWYATCCESNDSFGWTSYVHPLLKHLVAPLRASSPLRAPKWTLAFGANAKFLRADEEASFAGAVNEEVEYSTGSAPVEKDDPLETLGKWKFPASFRIAKVKSEKIRQCKEVTEEGFRARVVSGRLCPNIRSHQSYTRTTSCTCSNLGLIRHLMAIPTVKSIGHIPSEKLSDLHCRWKKVSKQDVPESDTMCDIFSGVDVQISTHDHLASLPKIYGGMSDYTPGKLKVKAPKQTPLKEIPEKYIQPGCGMKFGGEK
eukprot:1184601-Prorocentrum_minimum.AAC.3